MTIHDVYERYDIMPNLQQHMFGVAAVAEYIGSKLISAKLPDGALPFTSQDLDDVITATLLHDLGNMAKFKLDYFPEFLEPKGLNYWRNIQQHFWAKYGKNAHQATLKILDDLDVSDRIKELVDSVSFNKAKNNLDSPDYARKLCAYSDMRVGPHGVVSLDGRFEDGKKRYQTVVTADAFSYAMAACLRNIETQIFSAIPLQWQDITDALICPMTEKYVRAHK